MKQFICFLVRFYASQLYTQTVKDFVIPSGGYNKSNYIHSISNSKTGQRNSEETSTIWFIPRDTFYEIMVANYFQGQDAGGYSDLFSFTETVMYRIKSLRMMEPRITTYSPIQIYLELPTQKDKIISWNTDVNEKCSAEIKTVSVDNKSIKTLIVTRKVYDKGKYRYSTINYYPLGIGLWKTVMVFPSDNGISSVTYLQNQTYDNDVSESEYQWYNQPDN